MNPDLMRSAGIQLAFHQGVLVKLLQDTIVCPRFFAVSADCHFFPVNRMSANRTIHATLPPGDDTVNQGIVYSRHSSCLNFLDDMVLCFQRLSDDHQTAGFLIEPVNNTGPGDRGKS